MTFYMQMYFGVTLLNKINDLLLVFMLQCLHLCFLLIAKMNGDWVVQQTLS